jgi:hypothetical protein
MVERLAVIGNCQSGSVYNALGFLAPHANLTLLPVTELNQKFKNIDKLLHSLREFDFVLCQEFREGIIPGGDSAYLASQLPNVVHFPSIVFPAFHPDIVYVQYRGRNDELEMLKSPLGDYHSSLILFGFLEGFTPAQTKRLFAEDVLRRVGFLDAWLPAQQELLEAGEKVSMPLGKEFIAWSRQGCFMHSINHPRLFVLCDLTRVMLRRTGLRFRDEDPSLFLIDDLMTSIIWPTYPPIARSLGITGSYVFKKHMAPVYYDLDELITESYDIYSRNDNQRLTCWRMDLWRGDGELTDFVRRAVA